MFDGMTECRGTEFAAGGSATALRGLAQASGHDVARRNLLDTNSIPLIPRVSGR
jgi:hypothetical protein